MYLLHGNLNNFTIYGRQTKSMKKKYDLRNVLYIIMGKIYVPVAVISFAVFISVSVSSRLSAFVKKY